jgi:DnaJ domain
MFDRLYLREGAVVALPRRGTKTAGPVAFELEQGRQLELASLPASPEERARLRLDYVSSPVGRGPSQLRLFRGFAPEPLRTLELPDAISAVAGAPSGWYVGCRDGFLYGLDQAGELRWRWQTPGAAGFRPADPGELYFRPCPYRVASNGRSALVGWWGSLWSVSPEGVTEWALRLAELGERHVIEVRLGRQPHAEAAAALALPAQATPEQIKRAYRRAVKRTHPDLHPGDAGAAARFRRVQEAYEALSGGSPGRGNGASGGVIRFLFPSALTDSFLDADEGDWLVGGTAGSLYRLSNRGKLLARVRLGGGALFRIRDSQGAVVAFSSYPLALPAPPNLWFVDSDAPVTLPDAYPWPDHLRGSYGGYLLAHRPRGSSLGLIDETGMLAVQLRCPRPISSIAVADGVLVLAAGALICLEIDGLSPLTRTRNWRPPFKPEANPEQQP